ncbi:MAG: hypothetical protein ACTJLM_05040 [Ehrlichia sp.]
MLVLDDIIEIKLQIINILNIQIKYLRQLDFVTVKDLQLMEEKMAILLDSKCKKIKSNNSLISLCNDHNTIEILKDVCLSYEKILKVRNKLLLLYTYNVKLEKACKPNLK